MKSTRVQTLGAPTCVRSLAHNNYLLLGMVHNTWRAGIWNIREMQKDGVEFGRGHVKTEVNLLNLVIYSYL